MPQLIHAHAAVFLTPISRTKRLCFYWTRVDKHVSSHMSVHITPCMLCKFYRINKGLCLLHLLENENTKIGF